MPKFNMYQSLHTTVIGLEGKPVELQIRTFAHAPPRGVRHRRALEVQGGRRAPAGDTDARRSVDAGNADMAWVRQLLDWQQETEDPGEFLESLRFEINSAEVYVFTPRGDVIALPTGSSPVDFAYAIHTEVGHRTIGARVNGRLVPLESHARQRRRRRGVHLQGAQRRARAATGSASCSRRGPATRSGSGSPRSAARRPSSRARTRSPG